jgi:hypothetical protein
MSLQMTVNGAISTAAGAMPPDCPMHAQQASAADADGVAHDSGALPSCASCDLCLPIAKSAAPAVSMAAFTGHVMCATRDASALSVAASPSFKPPIS